MSNAVLVALSSMPLALTAVLWLVLYRAKKLRIRLMALTTSLSVFLASLLLLWWLDATGASEAPTQAALPTVGVVSLLFGLAVLALWPIGRRGLARKNILW